MEVDIEKEEQLTALTNAVGLTATPTKKSPPGSDELSEETKKLEFVIHALKKAAPSSCFEHVCKGNRSCFEPGMVVASCSGMGCVWPARILLVCGSLLELEWIGGNDAKFWIDCLSEPLYPFPVPVDLCLQPPDILPCGISYQDAITEAVALNNTLPIDWLDGNGSTLAERYRPGRIVLVLHEKDYRYFWVASILKNVGGRLLLEYDLNSEEKGKVFWLYYSDSRIYSLHRDLRTRALKPPSFLLFPSMEEWVNACEHAISQQAEDPIIDGTSNNVPSLPNNHGLITGMKLEMLDLEDKRHICYGIVSVILDRNYIKVSKEENLMACFCTSVDSCCIFPVGWAKENGLMVTEKCRCCPGLRYCSRQNMPPIMRNSPGSKKNLAPKEAFPTFRSAESRGWEVGHTLEVVHPHDESKICAATVRSLHGHLMYVRLNTLDIPHIEFLVPCTSLDIFPVGWCSMFGHMLQQPAFPKFLESKGESCLDDAKENRKNGFTYDQPIKIENCVEIFTNHMCDAGPLLSKSRLRNLPRSVGPGPVELVLKEVLTNVLNITYFLARARRLLKHEGEIPDGHVIETLKPKSQCDSIQVSVCTEVEKVSDYCKEVCRKMNCCPNLFSPVCFKEECTENCRVIAKRKMAKYNTMTRKRSEGASSTTMNYYKKRRRRGRRLGKSKESDSGDSGIPRKENRSTPKALKASTPRPHQQHVLLLSPRESMLQQKRRKLVHSSIQHLRRRHSSATDTPTKVSQTLNVTSNPATWDVDEVCAFLSCTSDCSSLVPLFKKEEIDGQALLLMTLPIALQTMRLSDSDARALCEHIIKLKAHFHRKWFPQLTGYRCM